MPGTPTSLSCDGCRRQKKKCDQVKPTCGRCKRVGIHCIGNGLKRWKFHSFQSQEFVDGVVPTPRRSPSNQRTKVTSSLVHILQIDDIRFDIRAFGGKFVPNLPSQVGCNPALDACVTAMTLLYRSHSCSKLKVEALTQYGEALVATRKAFSDPQESIYMKMQMVSAMYICQVLSSFINPQFELGPWFWEACDSMGTPRPVKYHQGSFMSLESGTMAEVSIFMRSPKKHLYQLQCIYNVIQFEMPKVRQLLALATMAAAAPKAPAMSIRVCGSYRVAYAILLGMTAIINHTLQIWDSDVTLVRELHDCVDESLAITHEAAHTRPYGAAFVTEFLTMIWAAAIDGYRNDEMATILLDYENDAVGADYLERAKLIRKRLQIMAMQETRDEMIPEAALEPTSEPDALFQETTSDDDEGYQEETPQCVIL
ncbi:hypothetical protein FSARC_14674 [Fusarium sarcochroum]|uniref:Zn(2)-C6 fungal-type domain-containing protein n=1 Tax=Fusarium sarcochroum TaxID=1208366 RepID=A0A8H4SRY9_9HYPO|nr:hypothetical protein FSARC_14674 [Fusarium sarcochroum]